MVGGSVGVVHQMRDDLISGVLQTVGVLVGVV